MTYPTVQELANSVGFDLPQHYNASRLLWDNLTVNAESVAILHDTGVWTYADLAAEASRIGNHLLRFSQAGDRVLLFLDDEPSYPAAIMGAMRAGLVPVLANTLSPPELTRFFLEDSGATSCIVSDTFSDVLTQETVQGLACKSVLVAGAGTIDIGGACDNAPGSSLLDVFFGFDRSAQGRRSSARGCRIHRRDVRCTHP